MNNSDTDIKMEMETEKKMQALADYLQLDSKVIAECSTRLNNITTFMAGKKIYLVGTEDEVKNGVRGYFEKNLGEIDPAFISRSASLSEEDSRVVERLCQIMDEDIETEILNDALLTIVKKCGDLDTLINTAAEEIKPAELLAEDGKETLFGIYQIYRFGEGQCSDLEH